MRILFVKLLFCVGVWMWGICSAHGQAIKGVVRAKTDNRALEGVSVQIAGKPATLTATNAEGHYQLNGGSTADSVLFSHVGFEPVTIAIAGQSTIDIQPRSIV